MSGASYSAHCSSVIFALAVLPLLFWGCSDDKFGSDSSSGKQISFRLQGNLPSSRITGTTKDNINAFVVNAQTDLPDDAGLLFSSQTVARLEGTANAFDYSPKRYYPDEAKTAEFSAYSPVTGKVDGFGGKTGSEINTITYTVPKPDINGNTTQEDLLVAHTPVEGAIQPSGGKPVHRGGFESPVQLTFKHALSRVFVRASNKNLEPVVIKELSLNNLYSKGTLKIDGDTWGSANGVADINEDYIKKEDIASADDPYKVLWTTDASDTEYKNQKYSYVLLPTGVSVPAETDKLGTDDKYVYVVGKDQGMLVLPQTTVNSNNDAEITSTEAATDFYVEVTYRLSNIQRTVRAAFTDINGLSPTGKGLTFEMGRQYALTLEFSDTAVEFDISVEGWEDDTDAYAQWKEPEWAQSNIYFAPDPDSDGSVGSLTFSETDPSKSSYQGLFFKWGSLIGIAAGADGDFDSNTYLYIPYISTGKYYKVKVSAVKNADAAQAVKDFANAVTGWAGTGNNGKNVETPNDWSRIPYVTESYDSGREKSPLTDASKQTYYNSYKGDICKFLSDNKAASKLNRNWVMPISDKWEGLENTPYSFDGEGKTIVLNGAWYSKNLSWSATEPFTPSSEDGTGYNEIARMTYTTTTGETVTFPASGYRSSGDGMLHVAGDYGGFYWSSSVYDAENAFDLDFDGSRVYPVYNDHRAYGQSVRCVRE
jgi:hypothetical protein